MWWCCSPFFTTTAGAGSSGALVAYRWDGEQALESSKFVAEPDRD
jgi:hypothetical protein